MSEADQVISEFTAGLEQARSRCGQLQARVSETKAKIEQVKSTASAELADFQQLIADTLEELRATLASAVQQATSSGDLARQLAERLEQSSAEAQTAIERCEQTAQQFASDVQGHATRIATLADTASERAQAIGTGASSAFDQSATELKGLADGTSTTLVDALDRQQSQFAAALEEAQDKIAQALERDAHQASTTTREQLDQLAEQTSTDVGSWGDSHAEEAQMQATSHEASWTTKFAALASSTEAFSGQVANVGENVVGIGRAMTESAETVTDAMEVTNVGLRTVVGIFENVTTIMDDIISFA